MDLSLLTWDPSLSSLATVTQAIPLLTLAWAWLALALAPSDRTETWGALATDDASERTARRLREIRAPRTDNLDAPGIPVARRPPSGSLDTPVPLAWLASTGVRAYCQGRARTMDRRRAALLYHARGLTVYPWQAVR